MHLFSLTDQCTRSGLPPRRRRFFCTALAVLLVCCAWLPGVVQAQDQPDAVNAPEALLQTLQADGTEVTAISHSRATGKVNFLRMAPTVSAAGVDAQQATQAAQATAFLDRYGALFGVADAPRQLQLAETTMDQWGATHLHYDQQHAGIPVYGGQLRLHFTAKGQLQTVNGTVIPAIDLDPTPTLTAEIAETIALAVVQKTYAAATLSLNLTVRDRTLYIYRTGLAQGILGRNHLSYEVAVLNPQHTIHELIYVDAHSGQVLDQISLIHSLDRQVYNGAFDPAALVWSEGDPLPYSGPDASNINRLIDYAEDTYNLFATLSGGAYRSFDGADATMHSVLIPDDPFICPNAYWDGFSTNYCRGIDTDDIVAHEWTHAYTQFSHNLIYQWQPGGLNEAYSDIFGEVVDLLNNAGLDDPDGLRTAGSCSLFSGADPGDASYRWLAGEEI